MSIISWSPISCCNGQTCKVSFSWSPILAAISKLFFCNGIFRGRVARGHEFTNRICWALTKRYAYKGRGEKVVIFQDFCHKASDPTSAPLMALLATHFLSHFFFLLRLNLTYMKRILHLVSVKNITFKSSYNRFKIDIHQQLRPLTANYLAMFKVTSTTIYT